MRGIGLGTRACARIGAENNTAVVGDTDDGGTHGVWTIEIS